MYLKNMKQYNQLTIISFLNFWFYTDGMVVVFIPDIYVGVDTVVVIVCCGLVVDVVGCST